MKKREMKIKARVSSKAKFSKKLQRKSGISPAPSASNRRQNKHEPIYQPSWAVDDNNDNEAQNDEIDVNDIMDMIDKENGHDLTSGFSNSIEGQYEAKAKRLAINNAVAKQEEEPEEDYNFGQDESDENQQPKDFYSELAGKSSVEALLIIQQLKAHLQEEVALTCDAIMSHPEANITRMNKLFKLLDTSTTSSEYGVIFFNVQQTVTESLCVIFNDIISNYRLAERFNVQDLDVKDKKQHLKKDTMRTYIYEKALMQYYKLYLARLQRMINAEVDPGGNRSNFYQQMLTTGKARRKLAYVACHCLSELLAHHYNFNCRADVISALAKVLCNTNRADDFMRDICAKAFTHLFKVDTLGEASLEAVNQISEFILKQNFRVPPLVFKTFLMLNLRELASDGNQMTAKKDNSGKKDRKLMSRKERKRAKHYGKMEKELLEAEATESNEKRYSFKVEIHKSLFALYFRFVKRCLAVTEFSTEAEERDFNHWYRALFPPLFHGMAQFSVYLNDNLIYELVENLLQLIKSEDKAKGHYCRLSSTERLCCLKTISQILTLTGNLLTIDFQVPYLILYELCTDPTIIYESMQMLLECIDEMVIKRFKQFSLKRVISFIQRLILLSLYLSGAEAIAFLTVIKRLFQQHQGAAEAIFELEEGLDNLPEFNSLNEFSKANLLMCYYKLVHHHSDPYVRYLAHAILVHFSDGGQGRTANLVENRIAIKKAKDLNLPSDICQELLRSPSPVYVYNLLNESTVCLSNIFYKAPTKMTSKPTNKGRIKSK